MSDSKTDKPEKPNHSPRIFQRNEEAPQENFCPKCGNLMTQGQKGWIGLATKNGSKIGLTLFVKRFIMKDFPKGFSQIKSFLCCNCGFIELYAEDFKFLKK